MNHILDTSEVLGTVATPGGTSEVCVSAEGGFDESKGRLVVRLEAFLRPTDLLARERHFRADWLPENETVTEVVDLDECRETAREIFHRWARKVREAAPRLHPVWT